VNAQAELTRTLTEVLETGRLANDVMQQATTELDRRKARIDQLEYLLHRMVLAHEDTSGNTDGQWPSLDTGCIECTQGATPDKYNTGLCAYHASRKALGLR
jgi:hypothetical protein